jgi:hypothetical protein
MGDLRHGQVAAAGDEMKGWRPRRANLQPRADKLSRCSHTPGIWLPYLLCPRMAG